MFYPARWQRITVDQSKVLKNRLFLFFGGATRYIVTTCTMDRHKRKRRGSGALVFKFFFLSQSHSGGVLCMMHKCGWYTEKYILSPLSQVVCFYALTFPHLCSFSPSLVKELLSPRRAPVLGMSQMSPSSSGYELSDLKNIKISAMHHAEIMHLWYFS